MRKRTTQKCAMDDAVQTARLYTLQSKYINAGSICKGAHAHAMRLWQPASDGAACAAGRPSVAAEKP